DGAHAVDARRQALAADLDGYFVDKVRLVLSRNVARISAVVHQRRKNEVAIRGLHAAGVALLCGSRLALVPYRVGKELLYIGGLRDRLSRGRPPHGRYKDRQRRNGRRRKRTDSMPTHSLKASIDFPAASGVYRIGPRARARVPSVFTAQHVVVIVDEHPFQ